MTKKLIIYLFLLLLFNSCVSTVRSLIGNQIIDSNYNPLPQSAPFYTEVPYQIEDGFITIKVRINSSEKEYNLIFDTGAQTMISERLTQEVNLIDGASLVTKDINENSIIGLTYRTNISIGNLYLRNIRLETSPTEILGEKCNHRFDGIIGSNVLKQGFFYFNATERKLVITNQKNKLPPKNLQHPIKLKRKMGTPYIKVKGDKNQWLLFDSGYASGTILLNDRSNLLNQKRKPIKEKYYGIKGLASEEMKLVRYYNQEINIGNYSNILQIRKRNGNGSNIIGNQIIQDNDIIIDVVNKKLYITSIYQSKITEDIPNLNFVYKNNNVVIGMIAKNPNIEKMSIRLNDTISKINDWDLKNIKDECEFEEFFKQHVLDQFPLTIEVKKNNQNKKYIINRKEYYE